MNDEILDSGSRREFSTGAVRDISDDKGRMDLLPLDIISNLINFINDYKEKVNKMEYKEIIPINRALTESDMFYYMNLFLRATSVEASTDNLYILLYKFIIKEYNNDVNEAIIELSKHFQKGAIKYAERNWEGCIPCHCYVDSALRHGVKYFRGDNDEPHNRAFMWNIVCLLWTMEHLPELNDLPFRDKKEENK